MSITGKTWFGLALATALVASGASASAGITNGGFESGNLTGWTATPGSLGAVNVVTSVAAPLSGGWYDNGNPLNTTDPIRPYEGDYFAQLVAGQKFVYTMLSQVFTVAVGDKLSFAAYFATREDVYNEDGYVKLLGVGANTGFELVMFSAKQDQVGQDGWTTWLTANYTFVTAGQYQIEAGVQNLQDSALPSQLGLDAVTLTTVPPPTGVPEPMSLAIWSVGGVALLLGRARRRRN